MKEEEIDQCSSACNARQVASLCCLCLHAKVSAWPLMHSMNTDARVTDSMWIRIDWYHRPSAECPSATTSPIASMPCTILMYGSNMMGQAVSHCSVP